MNRHQRRANMALLLPRKVVMHEQRNGVIVHELISKVAKELAGIFYDIAATQSNNFYKAFPEMESFVSTQWPDFVNEARQALVKKLSHSGTPDDQKEVIYDVLCLDRTCPKSQSRGLN